MTTTAPKRCTHALRVEHCATCSTRALLDQLATAVDQLAANLLPGTARPWRTPAVSAERRAELDRQAREDRLHIAQQGHLPPSLRGQSVVVPPGESPAPYDLDIADLLSTILAEADLAADQAAAVVESDLVSWAGAWAANLPSLAPPAASSAFADPRVHLAFLAEHAGTLARLDPDLLEVIAHSTARRLLEAQVALGLTFDGQLLPDACPFCSGRTPAHPVGGQQTLRIRIGPVEPNPRGQDGDLPGRPVIVCEGGLCEPGENSGQRWRGLPAWDLLNEGEWLRKCIAVAGTATTCRCGSPVLRSGRAGRPAAHCSETCRREADAERQRNSRAS